MYICNISIITKMALWQATHELGHMIYDFVVYVYIYIYNII